MLKRKYGKFQTLSHGQVKTSSDSRCVESYEVFERLWRWFVALAGYNGLYVWMDVNEMVHCSWWKFRWLVLWCLWCSW